MPYIVPGRYKLCMKLKAAAQEFRNGTSPRRAYGSVMLRLRLSDASLTAGRRFVYSSLTLRLRLGNASLAARRRFAYGTAMLRLRLADASLTARRRFAYGSATLCSRVGDDTSLLGIVTTNSFLVLGDDLRTIVKHLFDKSFIN